MLCLLSLFGVDVDESIKNMVDCFICTVMGCMNTQTGIELGLIDYNGDAGPVTEKQVMQ